MGSYVVTGAARGIGRAIAERLAADGPVVALDTDADALAWADGDRVVAVAGDAGDEAAAERAAGAAEAAAPLARLGQQRRACSATPPCTTRPRPTSSP